MLVFVRAVLQFRDNLGTKQQNNRNDFNAEQGHHCNGNGTLMYSHD
jgi:hypothetical protein